MLFGAELRETFPAKTKRNQFYGYELDDMRYFIAIRTGYLKSAAVTKFDRLRYAEDFEACAQMVTELGGEIISPMPGVPKHSLNRRCKKSQ